MIEHKKSATYPPVKSHTFPIQHNAKSIANLKDSVNVKNKHLVHVDRHKIFKKPEGKEYARLNNRLNDEQEEYLTIKQIAGSNVNGRAMVFAKFKDSRSTANFVQTTILVLDADACPSLEELLFNVKDEAAYIYETYSSTKEKPRCRIVYQLDTPIINAELYKRVALIKAQELESKMSGLKIDGASMDPCHIFLPGKKLIEINYSNELDGKKFVAEAERQLEEERKQQQEKKLRQLESGLEYSACFEELKEMAEHIGLVADRKKWIDLGLALKSHVEDGYITDDEGMELWYIMSYDYEEKRWEGLKIRDITDPKRITIGSFIYYAKQKGYERTFHHFPVKQVEIPTNTLTYKNYISECNQIMDMVLSERRILVESATGSGKSYAFVEAMKQTAPLQEGFFFFVTPTRALTEQIARERGIPCIIGSDKSNKNKKKAWATIQTAAENNQRVFAVIYDMVKPLYERIVKITKDADIRVNMVVDEYHKLLDDYDYSYRIKAIRDVLEIEKKARTVIGLSGTPQEIDLARFDQMTIFKQSEFVPIFNHFKVVSSTKKAHPKHNKGKDEYLADLSLLIKTRVTKGYKVLLFLNKKGEIEKLKQLLQKEQIKVGVITAETKNNAIYKTIVETGTVPEEVQVILATTVIADGISIRNENSKFDVIVVANAMSKIFKATTIKQISHRFRNGYENFILFVKEHEKDDKVKPFNAEGLYQYTCKLSQDLVSEFNDDEGFRIEKFHRSHVEKECGLEREGDSLMVDEYFLRHKAFERKASSMQSKIWLLVAELEEMFNVAAKHQSVTEIIDPTMQDEAEALQELRRLEELQKLSNEEKRIAFPIAFSKDVHEALQLGETIQIAQKFKKAVPADMYRAAVTISAIATYEQTKHLVSQVTKPAQTKEFVGSIDSLLDNLLFDSNTAESKTKKVVLDIQKLVGRPLTVTDRKIEQSRIAKKHKVKESVVERCFKNFEVERYKEGGERKTKIIRLKDEKSISAQFDLPVDEVVRITQSYLDLEIYKNKDKKMLWKVFEERYEQYIEMPF